MEKIAKPDLLWDAFLPELIIIGAAIAVLMVTLKRGRKSEIAGLVFGLGGAIAATVASWHTLDAAHYGAWSGQLDADGIASLGRLIVYSVVAIVLIAGFLGRPRDGRIGEYLSLTLLAASGMGMMMAAGSLVTLFVGLELFSIALYVLCALEADREHPLEAGMKYLVTGGIAAAAYLYGAALLYGATGSFGIIEIGSSAADAHGPMFWVGGGLILAALAFKAAAVPLHWWTPDVYEGAPTGTVAFMATAVKVVAVVTLIRVLVFMFGVERDAWEGLLEAIAVLSVVIGNFGALAQKSVKRMLAWSGIAHIGYIFIGLAAWAESGSQAVLSTIFYALIVYAVMTLGGFMLLMSRERVVSHELTFDDFDGTGLHHGNILGSSLAGLAMIIIMLSLAGIPMTGGFIAKFGLFNAAVEAGLMPLALVGILGSLISLGYYLKLPVHMFMKELPPRRSHEGMHLGLASIGVALAAVIIVLGVRPMEILTPAGDAVRTMDRAPIIKFIPGEIVE